MRLLFCIIALLLSSGCLSRGINTIKIEADPALIIGTVEIGTVHSGHAIPFPKYQTDLTGVAHLPYRHYLNSGSYVVVEIDGGDVYFSPNSFRFKAHRTLVLKLADGRKFEARPPLQRNLPPIFARETKTDDPFFKPDVRLDPQSFYINTGSQPAQ